MARHGIAEPIRRAFDEEELAGLRLATWARTTILAILAVQVAIMNAASSLYEAIASWAIRVYAAVSVLRKPASNSTATTTTRSTR